MLAASLVLGVMLGSTGRLDSTFQQVAEVTGLRSAQTDISTDNSQLALGEEIEAQPDEDML